MPSRNRLVKLDVQTLAGRVPEIWLPDNTSVVSWGRLNSLSDNEPVRSMLDRIMYCKLGEVLIGKSD